MYIPRSIEKDVKKNLFKKKIIIIYGPRQAGKTTLVKKIVGELKKSSVYFNCDEGDIRDKLNAATNSSQLKTLIGDSPIVIFDEAQRVGNIGLKLKLLVDNYPSQQVIATGSSSFELADKIKEPLTGRNWQFSLPPISALEILKASGRLEVQRDLQDLILYGGYPAVVTAKSLADKINILKQLTDDNLYKDVLKFFNLKGPETVRKLLAGLALQVGSEVSYEELGNLAGINKVTASSYIEILEKAFIIFKLRPLSRNLRKEISEKHKVYFFDTGVRNALINNFNPLELRNDKGAIWENFVIAERFKRQYWVGNSLNNYFWRTYDQQEVDLVEEKNGKFFAFEMKWNEMKNKPPVAWRENYPGSNWSSINKDNFLDYLL